MKASNIVVSTVAALSMASVLGIAYAQSTYSDPQTGTTNRGTSGTMNEQDATGTTTQRQHHAPGLHQHGLQHQHGLHQHVSFATHVQRARGTCRPQLRTVPGWAVSAVLVPRLH